MNKRLIFTVTTGRSGTMYLTHLLSGLTGIRAEHEMEPRFQAALPEARRQPGVARGFLQDRLPFIFSRPEPVQAIISHYFAKGFFEPLLDLGVTPDLILLARDPRKVASSFFLIGVARRRHKSDEFRKHMILPDEPNFLPPRDWWNWNEYQLYYWYALETRRRGQRYAERIASLGGSTLELSLEALTAGDDYRRLLEWMKVPGEIAQERLADREFRGRVLNDKRESKRKKRRDRELASLDLDALEAEVRQSCGLEEDARKHIARHDRRMLSL